MERSGKLLNRKYRALFLSTLAMTASSYLSAILDGIMVGRILGTTELYAINLTSSMVFLRTIPIAISTYGGNTLAVIYKSKRDQRGADIVFSLSFWGGILAVALMSVIGIATVRPISNLLAQGRPELSGLVAQYLLPLWMLTPLVAAVNQTAAFARTDGMRKLAIALPVVSNVVNLACDYLFMAVFGWGIAGAGYATIVGYIVGAFLTLIYFRAGARSVHFTKAALRAFGHLKETISTGLPSALIYVCNFLRLFFTNMIILSATGVDGGRIASVSFSLNSLAFILVEGASMTLLPILGALYGEKDVRGQKLVLQYGMAFTLALSLGVMVLSMLFPVQLAALFNLTEPELTGIFSVTFRILSINIPILAVIYVMRSFFQATKQKALANLLVMLDGFLVIVPLMYWFSRYGIYWLWGSFPVSKVITVALTLIAMVVSMKKNRKGNLLGFEEQPGDAFDFSIRTSLPEVMRAVKDVVRFCTEHGISGATARMAGITVEELGTNIVKYSGSGPDNTVDICVRILNHDVNVRIRDNGETFDPTNYYDDSGREITGLQLVRQVSASITYNRILGFNVTNVALASSSQLPDSVSLEREMNGGEGGR